MLPFINQEITLSVALFTPALTAILWDLIASGLL